MTNPRFLGTLAAAADYAAANWERWGPTAAVRYPVESWTAEYRNDAARLEAVCQEWLASHRVSEQFVDASIARLRALHQRGVKTTSIAESDYPPQLRAISNPPLVLHTEGDLGDLQAGVAIVGSREPELDHLEAVDSLTKWLVDNRIVVITGLARGIDKAAALVATRSGGRVVGVVPGAVTEEIPNESAEAYAAVRQRGCLVSEVTTLPRQSPGATKASFLRRNRIISGLSRMVVAFKPRTAGGTFNQLEWAAMQHRPVIAVLPEEMRSFAAAAKRRFPFVLSNGVDLPAATARLWTDDQQRVEQATL